MEPDKIKLRRLLRELSQMKGKHTELISYYIPAGSDLNKISELITQEQALTRNVKNKTVRKNVLSALEKIGQELKRYNKLPENGLAIFCGNVSEEEGKTDIKLWAVVPPEKIQVKLYWCDQKFELGPLEELAKEKNNYAIICLDKSSADIALISGKNITILKHLNSIVPGKTRAGGQCLSPDTLVQLSDGKIVEIKNLHNPCKVKSLNFQTYCFVDSKVKNKIENKKSTIYKIITKYPRSEIIASPEHKFFVVEEKIKEKIAEDLRVGDTLLMPEKIKIKGKKQFLDVNYYNSYKINAEGRKLLKSLREKKKLFQKELAKKIGVAQTTISVIELGKRNIKINLLRKICNFFGLNFEKFVNDYCNPNSKIKLHKELSPEIAQIIGYFLGDGSFERERINFFEEDEKVIRSYMKKIKQVFNANMNLKYRKNKRCFQLRVYGKSIVKFLKFNFPEIISARNSIIPEKILLSEENVGKAFLRGLYDAEGYVSGCIGFGVNNKKLAKMLQLFLLRFNIISSFHEYDNKRNKYSNNYRYTVSIYDTISLNNFFKHIGFTSNKKNKKLKELIEKKSNITRTRQIPFSGIYIKNLILCEGITLKQFQKVSNFWQDKRGMSKEVFKNSILSKIKNENLYFKLKKILDYPLIPVKIKKIEKLRKVINLVDISVAKENFIANCLLVHNSSVRFYRVRENLLISFLQKVSLTARNLLKEFELKGIIISGPGPIKEKFYNEGYLTPELKKKVIGIVDVSDTDEQGIRETLERGKDLIKETELVKEQELLKEFFVKLSKGKEDVVYGEEDTISSLQAGKVEVLLVSEDFSNLSKIEELCEQTNTKLELISTSSQEGVEFKNIGGIGAILRY